MLPGGDGGRETQRAGEEEGGQHIVFQTLLYFLKLS